MEAEDPKFKFNFPPVEPIGIHGAILTFKDVAFSYDGTKNVISNVNMRIDHDSRIAILGRNGSGKSTLLSLLVGNLQATKGEIYRYHNLRIGYFTQHHVEQLNLNVSPLEHMMSTFKNAKEQSMN